MIAGTLYFMCFYEGSWTCHNGINIAGSGKSDHICRSFTILELNISLTYETVSLTISSNVMVRLSMRLNRIKIFLFALVVAVTACAPPPKHTVLYANGITTSISKSFRPCQAQFADGQPPIIVNQELKKDGKDGRDLCYAGFALLYSQEPGQLSLESRNEFTDYRQLFGMGLYSESRIAGGYT